MNVISEAIKNTPQPLDLDIPLFCFSATWTFQMIGACIAVSTCKPSKKAELIFRVRLKFCSFCHDQLSNFLQQGAA